MSAQPNREAIAKGHADWRRRPTAAQSVGRYQSLEAIARMAEDLDRARQALTDLAFGVQVVLVVDPQNGQASPPNREQALDLATNPDLLPALFAQQLARVYTLPPDLSAIKTLMGYVMGTAPSSSEAQLRDELLQTQENQTYLAEVLRRYVPEDKFPEVSAELRRIAQGD